MNVTYDREADALYIRFREGAVTKSSDVDDGLVLDYGADGDLVGIEILRASKQITEPHAISYTAEPRARPYRSVEK